MRLVLGNIIDSAHRAIYRSLGRSTPSKEVLLVKTLLASEPACSVSKLLSGHSMGSSWVVSDYMSLCRDVRDLAVAIWKQHPAFPLSFMKDVFTSKAIALSYHTFGLSSSLNAIIGLAQLKGSIAAVANARALGDETGVLLGRISQVKSSSMAVAGVGFAISRPASIIAVAGDRPASSLVSRISSVCAWAGFAGYSVFFATLSASLGIQVYEGREFLSELKAKPTPQEQLAWLNSLMRPDPEILLANLRQTHGQDRAEEILIEQALQTCEQQLKELMKELGMPEVSEELRTEVVKEVVKQTCSGWTQAAVEKEMGHKLMMMGLRARVSKMQLKHLAKMERILSRSGLDAAGKVRSLQGRVAEIKVDEAKDLVETIERCARSKLVENTLVLATCVLGLIAMIASVVFTGGGALIASLAVMFAFGISMTLVDGYYLYQSYKSERPASQDKVMLLISTLMAVASALVVIALGATGVVSMGLFPAAVTAALGALWLAQNGVTYWIISRGERRYQVKNPTLKTLLEALHTGQNQERIAEMVSNLPEDLKKELEWALADSNQDMKRATLFVARKIEIAKEQRAQQLKGALAPLLANQLAAQ